MRNEITELNEMTKILSEQVSTLKDTIEILVYDVYGLRLDVMKEITAYTAEDIDNMSKENVDNLLIAHDGLTANFDEKFANNDKGITSLINYKKYVLKDILTHVQELEKAKQDASDIINDKNARMKEYLDEIREHSEERYAKRMELLEKKLATATTRLEQMKIQEIIDTFKSLKSKSYLFAGFEKDIDFEKMTIKNNFLDSRKGTFLVQKFMKQAKKLKINPEFYTIFINLEEKILPEKYHPFNNLYVFFIIRYIAYCDAYKSTSRVVALQLINDLQNALLDKFPNQEEKDIFVASVAKIIDYFMDDAEEFKKLNTTYKFHPVRVAHDKVLLEKAKREAELLEKATQLPVVGVGKYTVDGKKFEARYDKFCKECGQPLRWTDDATVGNDRVQCTNKKCWHHKFIEVNKGTLPNFAVDELPNIIDIPLPNNSVDADIKDVSDSE